MKIIRLNILPGGFKAINLFGVLFVKPNSVLNLKDLNHESIHTHQMRELLYIPFYVLYIIEWLVRLFMPGNAYRNISFEREAYDKEKDFEYLKNRKLFSSFKYFKNK